MDQCVITSFSQEGGRRARVRVTGDKTVEIGSDRDLKMPHPGCDDGGRGHEPRKVGSLLKLHKVREGDSLLEPSEEFVALPTPRL